MKEISVIQAEESVFNIMCRRSEILAKSSLIPSALRGKSPDILVIMMMAQELNIPPLQALNGINVIQGKAVISPQLMIALIRSKVPEAFIEIIEGEGICDCSMARDKKDKDQKYTSRWTVQRARDMGLVSKDNWKKQMGTMLKWRAVGDAARTVFPDILNGLYFADEFQDGTLPISDSGELQETPPPIPAEVIRPKEKDELTKKIFKHISKLTNGFTHKQRLDLLLKELVVSNSNEIEQLPESDKLEMISLLEQKIAEEMADE